MRVRARTFGLGVALVLSAATTGIWAWQPVRAYLNETAPKDAVMLHDGPKGAAIWGVWTGHSFAYGIETGVHSVALIDAGSDPDARAIIAQLTARDLTPADVHTIVLTHGHDEVQAGLVPFTNATIYVGLEDWTLARRDVLPKPWLAKLQAKSLRTHRLVKPAMQPMWPGQTLQLANRKAHLVALPGHTWGSFAVVVEDIAFVGDSVAGLEAYGGPGQAASIEGPRLFSQRLSVSPKHNAWTLARLVGTGFEHVATAHAGVLALNETRLVAWLQTQTPAPNPADR